MFGSRAASRVTENGGFGPLCPPGLFMSLSSLHASFASLPYSFFS